MSQPPTVTNPTLVNEESSQKELASTTISRDTAKALGLGFCVALGLPFLAQLGWQPGAGPFGGLTMPPTRESLQGLGRAVDEASILKQLVQPRLQELLTSVGGFGNDKVAIGRDGWLYYGPGLRYIFGHPFLDRDYLKAKAKAMVDKDGLERAHPDPLPAFQQLAEDCRRLGIALILLPVADKGMVTPEYLMGRARGRLPQNRDFETFRKAVEGMGVEVLSTTGMIEPADRPWYLKQDTHWTPKHMDRVARGLAERLRARGLGGARGSAALYELKAREVSSLGDLVGMLKLPGEQLLYSQETVRIEEVVPLVKPVGDPEILLLGDSFTNIYSSPSLAWGERAGLGEHLAYHLNAPVDILAMNGAGASVRQELRRAAGTGRMSSTRAIVYEFAIRDLYLEDWPPVAVGEVRRKFVSSVSVVPVETKGVEQAAAEKFLAPPVADSEELTVTGTITQMSRAIDRSTAPYEDALIYGTMKVDRVEVGSYGKPRAIVVFEAMRKRVMLAGANHKVGETVRLRLIRLKSAPEEIRGMQRSDDTEEFELVPYLAVEELPPAP